MPPKLTLYPNGQLISHPNGRIRHTVLPNAGIDGPSTWICACVTGDTFNKYTAATNNSSVAGIALEVENRRRNTAEDKKKKRKSKKKKEQKVKKRNG